MHACEVFSAGTWAERTLIVPPEQTVGHVLAGMPMVFSTPMMIMQMELAAVDALRSNLPAGWVTVGIEVNIRHLAAAPLGAVVRTTAKVVGMERRMIRFEVASYFGDRSIGEGIHCRGLVDIEKFAKRQLAPNENSDSVGPR